MKIISFELENVKRVALVRMAPNESGLTVIGGKNAAGKTSVLDGIVYALGGEKYRPGNLQRTDGLAPARIRIELSGGIVVERKGKNAALKVTDATGKRAGQALLNDFIEELALNLPKFLAMRDEDKAEVLLRTLGIGEKLRALDVREKAAYDKRHDFGVIVDQKRKYAAEMKEYADVPDVPVSAAEIIAESQAILGRNQERQRRRREASARHDAMVREEADIQRLKAQIAEKEAHLKALHDEDVLDSASVITPDESTAELERKIADIDGINAKVRANLDKARAIADAEEYERKLALLTDALEAVRRERRDLLSGAKMPLADLTVGKSEQGRPVLLYRNQPWDCMSTMERYRVAAAIVRKLKPECGFVLLDGLEAFDADQTAAFDAWLKAEDLQAICTRVGTDDCSIVIEDGYAVEEGVEPAPEVPDENAPIPMSDQSDASDDDNKEMEW